MHDSCTARNVNGKGALSAAWTRASCADFRNVRGQAAKSSARIALRAADHLQLVVPWAEQTSLGEVQTC